MDIKKLKYFCSVANYLNFSKAAKENHIAQTAMSRHIAAMEEELGFTLFKRNRNKVELTPAGVSFYKSARNMVDEYDMAQQNGIEIANGEQGCLTVGFGGFDICYVRALLPGFVKEHPEYMIWLKEYPYDSIVESLISNDCDVIFCPNSRLNKQKDIRKLVTGRSKNVIAVGEAHPLYAKDELLPEDLHGQTFICAYDTKHSWYQLRQHEYICSVYGIDPGKRVYTNSAISLLTMVEMGVGVAFLTQNVSVYDTKIKLIPIKSETQSSRVHVVACSEYVENPLAEIFMDHMEQQLKHMEWDD